MAGLQINRISSLDTISKSHNIATVTLYTILQGFFIVTIMDFNLYTVK